MGLGALGLASLLSEEFLAAAEPGGLVKATHFPAKARHVIHIFAQGAPSHVDTWDPKPALAKYADQPLPDLNGVAMPSPFKFVRHGGLAAILRKRLAYDSDYVTFRAIIPSGRGDRQTSRATS